MEKNLGAEVTLRNQNGKLRWRVAIRGNTTWRVPRCGDYNEPSAFLNTVLSNSSINTVFYKSPAFDAIMAATLKAPDEAARAALYQQAEAQLDKDSALVPVYYRVSARLIKPTVGGFTGKDPLDYTDVKNLYIIKQ